jgi:hypothetical protein
MTLDAAEIDLSRAFTPGMGYVALSRVRNLNNLYILGMNNMALRVSEEAMQLEEDLQKASRRAVQENMKLFEQTEKRWSVEASSPVSISPVAKGASSWKDKIAKMRTEYPNAYKPWTDNDDSKLLELHKKGAKTKELTEVFGRHPGSIRAHLKKFLEE